MKTQSVYLLAASSAFVFLLVVYFILQEETQQNNIQFKVIQTKKTGDQQEEQDMRAYILSKNCLTKVQDIKYSSQIHKTYGIALNIDKTIRNNSFDPSNFPIKRYKIPFRNEGVYLTYTKAETDKLCVYEPATTLALSVLIKPYFKIIDCGSHLGFHSFRMAALINEEKGGKQYTFEPNPLSFQFLNASIIINKFGKKMELYNYAISNKTQEMDFNLYQRGYQSSLDFLNRKRISNKIKQRSDKEEKTQVKILAISLDDFFPAHILPEAHLIKMDIENAELLAIQGAQRLIKRSQNVIIIMEW